MRAQLIAALDARIDGGEMALLATVDQCIAAIDRAAGEAGGDNSQVGGELDREILQ